MHICMYAHENGNYYEYYKLFNTLILPYSIIFSISWIIMYIWEFFVM